MKSDPKERARRYLAKMPPSISGSGGHRAAYAVAVALMKGFAFSEETALELFSEWNATYALPPWSIAELRHKLMDATKADGRTGSLLNDHKPAGAWLPVTPTRLQ